MINAKCYSDDGAVEVNFDATAWFEQATDEQIKELADIEWGGNYASDDVALHMATVDKKVQKVFDYCEINRDMPGFECRVNPQDAIAWVKANRPSLTLESQSV